MRGFILLQLLLQVFVLNALEPITISNEVMVNGRISIAEYSELFTDDSNELNINDVLSLDEFKAINEPSLNLNFTTSSHWMRFELKSAFDEEVNFILELARPLTNVADLYVTNDKGNIEYYPQGDAIKFDERTVKHRKMLHNISLKPGSSVRYYVNLRSDGEVITLPAVLWDKNVFLGKDGDEQLLLGIYYGILLFVIIIYFIFYRALRDKTFLYYVLYVLNLMIFQLSFDGLSFQYLWPNNVWLGNHTIIIFAATTVFMVNLYAKTYLKTSVNAPSLEKVFIFFLILSALSAILGITSGSTYALAFKIVNSLAMISTLFILFAIIITIRKNISVNPFFILAFIVLIFGSFLFIFTNFSLLPKNLFTEHGIKFGSALEVIFLSITMAGKYQEAQREKESAQKEALEKLEEINFMKEEANLKLELQVNERTAEIEQQKEEIEEKNKDIMGSIHYAQRIQNAILPSSTLINDCLPESFVLFKPKDIVSGDFYWVSPVTTSNTNEKVILFCVADCTGHGVPGAFMSLIGNSYLKLSLNEPSVNSPAQALDFLNKGVISTLQQNNTEKIKDGMDLALCAWFKTSNKLYFSGAKNPLYIIKNGELIEIKGDKHPIGAYLDGTLEPFTNHAVDLEGGECIYLFSDGYPDQFGGEKGKKFMYGKFKKLLLEIHTKPMKEQQQILNDRFVEWQGDMEQIDDVCIVGVRV